MLPEGANVPDTTTIATEETSNGSESSFDLNQDGTIELKEIIKYRKRFGTVAYFKQAENHLQTDPELYEHIEGLEESL